MESQIRALGVLSICAGILSAILALAAMPLGSVSFASSLIPFGELMISGLLIWMAALSIPYFVTGIGLIQHKVWARTSGTIVLAGGLLFFPLGTALGLWGLVVLMSSEADAVFSPRFGQAPKLLRR